MTHGPPPDVRLRYGTHLDRGQYPRRHALLFQHGLYGQGVDHRGQHAHVIPRRLVDARFDTLSAAEDVSAAHHQTHRNAQAGHFHDLVAEVTHKVEIDTALSFFFERFPAEFQQDALIYGIRQGAYPLDCASASATSSARFD